MNLRRIAEIETDKATMEVEAGRGHARQDPGARRHCRCCGQYADRGDSREGEDKAAIKATKPSQQQKAAESAPPVQAQKQEAKVQEAPAPKPSKAPEAPVQHIASDPDIPEGTEMVTMTMREALRDAMAEEMRRDKGVRHGRRGRRISGRLQGHAGALQEFGAGVIDTPITEHGFAGLGIGAGLAGLKPIVEFMTSTRRHAGNGSTHQPRGQNALHVRRADGVSICIPRSEGAAARVAAQHSQDYSAWYSHIPGLKVIAPSTAADAKDS